jgi:hypothetical protein
MNPCKRRIFIKKLRKLGFDVPYSGAKHEFMIYGNYRLAIPSNNEFSITQLKFMLAEIQEIIDKSISSEEWERM